MKKEDINTFDDHGDFISINLTPYYTANHVNKMLLQGVFLGMLAGAVFGILLFKLFTQ